MDTTTTLHEPEPSAPRAKTPQPKTAAARKLVETLNACIGVIEGQRDVALKNQEQHPGFITELLLDGLLLLEILTSWDSTSPCCDPLEQPALIGAIRSNLDL